MNDGNYTEVKFGEFSDFYPDNITQISFENHSKWYRYRSLTLEFSDRKSIF